MSPSDVTPSGRPAAAPSADADPRLAFIYQEAVRGLLQQQSVIEGLKSQAGTLVFAASFASSLLGSRALTDGVGAWDWFALGLLFGIGGLTVIMLWPYYDLSFRFDPDELLARYVDEGSAATMSQIHRELAIRAEADRRRNGHIVRRLRVTFEIALVLLLLNILAWLCSIADVFG
jgi:uncharacterized membrane protein